MVALTLSAIQVTANASGVANALNVDSGIVTTQPLTTGANSTVTLQVFGNFGKDSVVAHQVQNGTNSTGIPMIATTQVSGKSVIFTIYNASGSAAFNGTLLVSFVIFK